MFRLRRDLTGTFEFVIAFWAGTFEFVIASWAGTFELVIAFWAGKFELVIAFWSWLGCNSECGPVVGSACLCVSACQPLCDIFCHYVTQ